MTKRFGEFWQVCLKILLFIGPILTDLSNSLSLAQCMVKGKLCVSLKIFHRYMYSAWTGKIKYKHGLPKNYGFFLF